MTTPDSRKKGPKTQFVESRGKLKNTGNTPHTEERRGLNGRRAANGRGERERLRGNFYKDEIANRYP